MNRMTGLLTLALIACAGGEKDEITDTDTDGGVETDTDTTTETDVTTETGDTGGDTDTDVVDTDVVDTDGESVHLQGQLWCTLPGVDSDEPDGVPATPGFAKITIVEPWTCVPLGPCSENTSLEILAETTLDDQGRFTLDFQTGPYTVAELYLYTNNDIGVCGNGYQYTQLKLTEYPDWDDIVIDVDSIWH